MNNRLINAVDGAEGKAAQPSKEGFELLNNQVASKTWTLGRRLVLFGIIATLIGIAVGLWIWLFPR